ncbi:hypothetical protein DMN91_002767 [Ooceraea biroi]|uniref:Uncharacterized protein n=1 Tax=Ooceraea biroi TaxID=2015173 RepID=A0A3L8DXY7_OOCBI|nr:hypothetical protein DMN91_002767 [Ooceraea biroi]
MENGRTSRTTCYRRQFLGQSDARRQLYDSEVSPAYDSRLRDPNRATWSLPPSPPPARDDLATCRPRPLIQVSVSTRENLCSRNPPSFHARYQGENVTVEPDTRNTSKKKSSVKRTAFNVEGKTPIIECKRKEFNFYEGQTYPKREIIQLASKGWHHYKSKGITSSYNPLCM